MDFYFHYFSSCRDHCFQWPSWGVWEVEHRSTRCFRWQCCKYSLIFLQFVLLPVYCLLSIINDIGYGLFHFRIVLICDVFCVQLGWFFSGFLSPLQHIDCYVQAMISVDNVYSVDVRCKKRMERWPGGGGTPHTFFIVTKILNTDSEVYIVRVRHLVHFY